MNWFLLIFSILTLVASISLIKWHYELDAILSDITDRRHVPYSEFLLSGVLGFIGLPASMFAVGVSVVLVILE